MAFESKREILGALRALAAGEVLPAEPEDLGLLMEASSVNTLLCDAPYSRTHLTAGVAAAAASRGRLVLYIDIDTAFTVFLEEGGFPGMENIVVLQPNLGEVDEAIVRVCASTPGRLGLIVLDSVTNFYHISGEAGNFARLNRKLGVYLALLQGVASRHQAILLVTSLLKARVQAREEASAPIPTHAGGRLLERRSKTIFSLKGGDRFVDVTIMRHPDAGVANRVLRVPSPYPSTP